MADEPGAPSRQPLDDARFRRRIFIGRAIGFTVVAVPIGLVVFARIALLEYTASDFEPGPRIWWIGLAVLAAVTFGGVMWVVRGPRND